MEKVTRFGVSMEPELLGKFDDLCDKRGYSNRSEAVRDLVRDALVQESARSTKGDVVGTISIVYDHHEGDLNDKLVDIQHRFYREISSSTHIHLDHDNCLEVIIVKGRAGRVKELGDILQAQKGVKHGGTFVTTTSM